MPAHRPSFSVSQFSRAAVVATLVAIPAAVLWSLLLQKAAGRPDAAQAEAFEFLFGLSMLAASLVTLVFYLADRLGPSPRRDALLGCAMALAVSAGVLMLRPEAAAALAVPPVLPASTHLVAGLAAIPVLWSATRPRARAG